MNRPIDIDDIDKQILALLMEDAKTPYTDIAKKIHVSGGTVHVRMKKLIDSGVVQGSNLTIDHEKLGYDICAFLGIYLNKSSLYEEVIDGLDQIPEIVSAHYTTGVYSIFAKLICRDTNHLRDVLHDKIQNIAGIQRTETFISLQESINRPVNITEDVKEMRGSF
ncbi:MAG: Lrp/AsnC ligand binding domain-containing protein [Saprospiraceae bacterium]